MNEFLFVYGDKPTAGDRTSELTVRAMIEEARGLGDDPAFTGSAPFRVGVASGLRRLAATIPGIQIRRIWWSGCRRTAVRG